MATTAPHSRLSAHFSLPDAPLCPLPFVDASSDDPKDIDRNSTADTERPVTQLTRRRLRLSANRRVHKHRHFSTRRVRPLFPRSPPSRTTSSDLGARSPDRPTRRWPLYRSRRPSTSLAARPNAQHPDSSLTGRLITLSPPEQSLHRPPGQLSKRRQLVSPPYKPRVHSRVHPLPTSSPHQQRKTPSKDTSVPPTFHSFRQRQTTSSSRHAASGLFDSVLGIPSSTYVLLQAPVESIQNVLCSTSLIILIVGLGLPAR